MFQSTPPRGGRRYQSHHPRRLRCFNPRPRAGGDWSSGLDRIRSYGFNPRPRAGGDYGMMHSDQTAYMFQSTPPRGGRRDDYHPQRTIAWTFQSTPPRGGRRLRTSIAHWPNVFQSTPPRGGRLFTSNCFKTLNLSRQFCEPVPKLSQHYLFFKELFLQLVDFL